MHQDAVFIFIAIDAQIPRIAAVTFSPAPRHLRWDRKSETIASPLKEALMLFRF
jgi:hypothetical protein